MICDETESYDVNIQSNINDVHFFLSLCLSPSKYRHGIDGMTFIVTERASALFICTIE